jgi:hypothetical protein
MKKEDTAMGISAPTENGLTSITNSVSCSDRSLWSLIFWNLLTIVWAVIARWSMGSLMAVYWCQSLILGFFWFLRIIILPDFYVPQQQDLSIEQAFQAKATTAAGFIAIYSILHVFAGLALYRWLGPVSTGGILIVAGIFFLSQCFGFSRTAAWISGDRPTSSIVFFPYIRVLPMFAPLIVMAKAGLTGQMLLVVFLLAKTAVDAAMHIVERSHFGDSSYPERTFRDYERKEAKGTDECDFCGRVVEESEAVRHIKNHVVCMECWKKIENEKDKAR